MSTSAALQIHNIYQTFGQKTILSQIHLSVQYGEIVAILGASGSGKSTLLNIVAGLQTPTQGEIYLNGDNITFRQPEKRGMAMMFQDFALLPHLNTWQNVAFGLKLQGVNPRVAQEKAMAMLGEVGLDYAVQRRIGQLSGGEQQRVALARALAIEPKALLLDEPFSSLDSHWRQQLQQQIHRLIQQKHLPTLLVSHDPAEASLIAQHIALLSGGRIIQYGTPAQLFAKPISAAAARLLGCLNVSETHYIPPQSIDFVEADNDGVRCEVLACFRQPAHWRVQLKHPKWGELLAFHQHHIAAASVNVKIDARQIILFD